MAGLSYHLTVDAPSTFGEDSAEVTQSKLNDNMNLLEANDQALENRLENTWYDAKGSGILSGMEASLPVYGGMTVQVAVGVALIGYSIAVPAQSVAVTASMSPGYLYFCQDGTFHNAGASATPPAGKSSFLYCTYTSDGYDTLTVTLATRGLEYAKIEASVAGAVSLGVIKTIVADRDFWIEDVEIVAGNPGLYNNTLVDVHVGNAGAVPTTIFTNQANRPAIAAASNPYTTGLSGTPKANRSVTKGQVVLIEVDQIGTGCVDLGVTVRGRYCDIA